MKSNLFSTLFLFISLNCLAQNKIVNEGRIWSVIDCQCAVGCVCNTHYVKFSGDSVDNFITYKKVYQAYDSLHNSWNFYGLIREQIDKKIFFKKGSHETLIYDFALQPGDTAKLKNWYNQDINILVDSIDSILIDGSYLKRYNLQYGIKWIEQIGSSAGVLNEFILTPDFGSFLLCYSKNDSIKYINPTYNSCYITTGIYEYSKADNIKVYPNPTNSIVNIEIQNLNKYEIKILTILGKAIEAPIFSMPISQHNNSTIQIDISELPRGIYFIQLANSNQFYITKILKD